MKLIWKLLLAFYLPIHFAVGCFYVANPVLEGKIDCRNSCVIYFNSYADDRTLMLFDFFAYSGIGLLLLAFILPLMILRRSHPLYQNNVLGLD